MSTLITQDHKQEQDSQVLIIYSIAIDDCGKHYYFQYKNLILEKLKSNSLK